MDRLKNAATPEATDTGTAIGDAIDEGVKAGLAPGDAVNTADAYIQGLDSQFDATTVADAAGTMAEGVDKKVADTLSPERAGEIVTDFMDSAGTTFQNTPLLPGVMETVTRNLSDQFRQGLLDGTLTEEQAAEIVKKATTLLAQIAGSSARPDMQDVGKAIDDGIGQGAIDNVAESLTPLIASAIKDATNNLYDTAKSSGADNIGAPLALGIADGIVQNTPAVEQAARDAVKAAIQAAKDEGRIKSPSEATAEVVGLPLVQGIGVGFLSGVGGVSAQVQASVADLISGAGGALTRGMGSLVAEMHSELGQQIALENQTTGESPYQTIPDVTSPNATAGFSEFTTSWMNKLLASVESGVFGSDKQ